jgi:hypothetical protein
MPSLSDAPILRPSDYVTEHVVAFATDTGQARSVDGANPLPVCAILPSAGSAPLAGNTGASGLLGPFVPDPGRAIWITLMGSWTGSVTVLGSTDGGATTQPLTLGGSAWGSFTANANEAVGEESVAGATWYLQAALTSGTLGYRVQQ